jgi:ribose transport system ATP-binding protein
MSDCALSISGVTKTFGNMKALDDVDLRLAPGEILGLLGANGSGKSTLIKVLAGFHDPDAGRITIGGTELTLPVVGTEARHLGLRFVHQDLGLIPSLTVLENLMLGELSTDRRWRVPWRREREAARQLFASYGVELDPDGVVEDLPPVSQAMLAIVRAVREFATLGERPQAGVGEELIGAGHGVLVLDEPTVFLSGRERDRLFELLNRLAAGGVAVIFVSHDIDEVRELCQRAVVLRDGRVAADLVMSETSDDELVQAIVGGIIDRYTRGTAASVEQPDPADRPSLRVEDLRGGPVTEVDFTVAPGEILGLTGLSGAGFEAIPYLLYGALAADGGTLWVGELAIDLRQFSPSDAIEAGITLVPADRAKDAVVGELSLADNMMLPVLREHFTHGRLRARAMQRDCDQLLERFRVKSDGPAAPVSSLSGGNQQRAVLAKWLQMRPSVLLLHEPTQGVDIGARQDIFRLLRAAVDGGTTVVCASSDYEQLAAVCGRVLVFRNGRVAVEITGGDVNKDYIAQACHSAPANTI